MADDEKSRETKKAEKTEWKRTFEAQLEEFLRRNLLTEDEIRARYEPARVEVDRVLKRIYPNCVTRRFGSTACGLAMKSSDLDLYFHPGVPIAYESNVGTHMITFDRLFADIEKRLYQHPELFYKVVPIHAAKVPIIKFVYRPTNVRCDLSFRTCLGVYNTQLIKAYISSDPKFLPTMLIIKHWINQCDLNARVTKYALAVLFIFYLQQLKLVPSVAELKENVKRPFRIQGWLVYYDRGVQDFQARHSDKSIPELLHGFFDYYARYDFVNNTISVNDGQSYPRVIANKQNVLVDTLILQNEQTNSKEDEYGAISPAYVEDPIELNANVMKNIKIYHLRDFRTYCSDTAKIIKESAENNYVDLFGKIFDFQLKEGEIFTFDIPTSVLVNENLEDINNINSWFDEILFYTKRFLEEVLCLDVKIISNVEEQNENLEKDSINKRPHVTTLHCKSFYNLWDSREKEISNVDFMNALEKEILISKVMLKKSNVTNKKVVVDFVCQFIRMTNANPLQVCYKFFRCDCKEKVFHSIFRYLNLKMTSVIRKTFNYQHQLKKISKKTTKKSKS